MPQKTKSGKPAQKQSSQRKLAPWMLITIILIAAATLGVIALLVLNRDSASPAIASLPGTITVQEAYDFYQQDVFVLDVRTQEEWDDYHIPNTTLIPLDQLESRLSELPDEQQIVVICRTGNRSQSGRDILLNAGLTATSVDGGVSAWRSAGYPIE